MAPGPSSSSHPTCSQWCTPDQVAAAGDAEFNATLLDDVCWMATEVLYNFTRRRWGGICTDVIRPCNRACLTPGMGCGCGYLSQFLLPGRPVVAITEVLVDGALVPAGEYRLDDKKMLVGLEKADGRLRVWPSCQRLDLAVTERFTWQVTYTYGAEPPPGGVRAAISLAYQLALMLTPATEGKCRLPKRVTSISRQGVTLAILDPLTLFKDGQTGLAEVDLWVAGVNRGSDMRSAVLIDPMRHASARRTS